MNNLECTIIFFISKTKMQQYNNPTLKEKDFKKEESSAEVGFDAKLIS